MSKQNRSTFSRRAILAALLAGAGQMALGAPITQSPLPRPRPADLARRAAPAAADLIAAANLGGELGYAVADATTGTLLEVYDATRPMPPASVAKAVTALYALDALGADYRFATRLMATGPIVDGRIEGDLILAGSGDPSLDTDALADMAARLAGLGVREVAGALRVDAGALPRLHEIDTDQLPHAGYNPAISGLNLNFNRVHFEWKRQDGDYALSMQARTDRYQPSVRMAAMQIAAREQPLFTYAANGETEQWSVARNALGNGGSRWLPVRNPPAYAAEVFATLARGQGISFQGRAQASGPMMTEILRQDSAPLAEILADMLHFSTNLTAEVVGLSASRARGFAAPTLVSSAAQMNAWAAGALGAERAAFVDHSGLGHGSRIAAVDMVRLLSHGAVRGALLPILKPFDFRDTQGRVDRSLPMQVLAKTGTLDFVSGLAGYIHPPGGRALVFAIFSGDLPRRASARAAGHELPPGGREWTRRARTLQQELIKRWAVVYDA